MERTGTQGIQFIVQIILARLIEPEQFGAIAIVMVFINLAQVFVQNGFSTALIQKKNADDLDFSSVLYLSFGISFLFSLLLYVTAPTISDFYKQPQLTAILRVLTITLFAGAFNSIQIAYVARKMQFKRLFFSSLGAVSISGVVGVLMAYNHYGIWSLVVQQIINQFLVATILWFTVKWRPKLIFSLNRVKVLFSYGSNLLLSAIIDSLYRDLSTMYIGKIYSTSTLGYYNRGQQFPQFIVGNINGSIQSVMLPALSSQQENRNRVKEMTRRAIMTSSYVIFPMMIGLAAAADPIVRIVLTEKWLPAVPFLQIFCFSFALWPIHTANLQAINALGKSNIYLKLEIIKKIFGLMILAISINYGVYAIALSQVVSGIISSFVNAYPNKRLLNYSYSEQIKDVFPSFLISAAMGFLVYIIGLLDLSPFAVLGIQMTAGVLFYVIISKIFRVESFEYLLNTLKEISLIKTP